jgi:hypothetical protein
MDRDPVPPTAPEPPPARVALPPAAPTPPPADPARPAFADRVRKYGHYDKLQG